MKDFEIVFKSKNIDYIKLSENLIDDYLKMVNTPEIQMMISKKSVIYTYDDELKWLKTKLEEKSIIFSMIERSTGLFIGNIEFFNIENKQAEIGICITTKQQNKHYGKEAMKTFISYGFNELRLEKIILNVFSNNETAIKLYKELGFIEYNIDKNIKTVNSVIIDNISMELKNKS